MGCLYLYLRRLPEIQEELYKVLQQTEKELEDLPQPPSENPLSEVLRVIDAFKKDLSERVEGTPEPDGLLQTIRPYTATFRHRIYATAPDFVPWEKYNDHANRSMPGATFLSNEEEDDSNVHYEAHAIEIYADSRIFVDQVMDRAQTLVLTRFSDARSS